jgi:hypothetical protein
VVILVVYNFFYQVYDLLENNKTKITEDSDFIEFIFILLVMLTRFLILYLAGTFSLIV